MSAAPKTLYENVMEKVEMAKAKVIEVGEKLKEFDTKESAATGREKASSYLQMTLDKAQEALADLARHAQALKDNATEIPMRAFTNAFARANNALTELKERAKAFDDQHQLTTKVSDVVHHPQEQASVAIGTASTYVSDAAHAAYSQLQGVSDGMKVKVMAAANQGLDRVLPVAATVDEKLFISQNAGAFLQQLKSFDQQYHVLDKVLDLDRRWAISSFFASALSSLGNLDQRVTGGAVQPVVVSAYETGLNMAGYVAQKYDEAKTSTGSPAAPSASTDANEVKDVAAPTEAQAPAEPETKTE